MLKKLLLGWAILFFSGLWAQEIETPYKARKILASRDTIAVDSVSVNSAFFKLLDKNQREIDTAFYHMDFAQGKLVLKPNFAYFSDTLTVRFLKFPESLTKTYSIYNQSRVVKTETGQYRLYEVSSNPYKKFTPFDGLNTSGSITRGVTVGNNQNTVVNSNLDLQITGRISDKVSIRASIQDNNIPLQNNGYSQKMDEFDQIFVELFGQRWSIRAGDLFLENRQLRLLNFSKKVQGMATRFNFGAPDKTTEVFASAGLVRGQYARSTFVGQEGNQGPYKLRGNNGELYVLVISGSERVYVNGILLKRGENNDYVIDYNAGEVTFTSLFPITSEMRINIEYQFSDRNYSRLVTHFGAEHKRDDWSIGAQVYSENDLKNQPLQQNLSEEQAQILAQAGDDQNLMVAPSAYVDTFAENKILYEKVTQDGLETFVRSSNPDAVLYNVRFTFIGKEQGDYDVSNEAVGRVYVYVPRQNGQKKGSYEPIIKLIAPVKLQMATVFGKFNPSEKTSIDFETAMSNNDVNMFSSKDDSNNQGSAGKINARQRLFTGKWKIDALSNYQFIQKNFRTIERLNSIEFDRDWNLTSASGNQGLFSGGILAELSQKGSLGYQFENLNFSENFNGNRHSLNTVFALNQWNIQSKSSVMNSNGSLSNSKFIRSKSQLKYHFKKQWIGSSLRLENNQERVKSTGLLSSLSQRFTEYGAFVGRGDSTKVFAELGFLHRVNDSLVGNRLQKVNTSNTYYVKSKLLQNEQHDLAVFVNYRNLSYEDATRADEPSLNSRVLYSGRFLNQFIQTTTAYETASGTIARQEFTYLEVEPGRGVYAWNDYNNNGIQELQEFEIAPFPDQAKYIRVFLPNQIFEKTHQNKFSSTLTLNALQWQQKNGIRKVLSHFYNQTSYLIDRKISRNGSNFDLNPFSGSEKELLGLTTSVRNSLFYNRGKQKHSVTYNYLENRARNLLSAGAQENNNLSHQIQYMHLIQKLWLMDFSAKLGRSTSTAENYAARNYRLHLWQVNPKISYLFSENASWDIFYEYQDKRNVLSHVETLKQTRIGTSFTYNGLKKISMNGEFSLYKNDFTGDALSPVAFQMLEGLQPGQNTTWRLLFQKSLTDYLDVNLSYQGRKSQTSNTIHNGSIQLRAYF
ncbi:hypothetical protein KIH23_01620 [Flavobacterium sp. CYK-55]|uniref:hypothetical protein n=1 Tax=Flavobacterium sp. CYK-55 TaxID=2835529 RepID=UPI001BD0F4C6|nr:hypothetical protein [Flavobacterium sp. CYK-55]MBS7785982.1 hypothetical protein [Flavobacterium sp. CYK-55]